MVVLNLSAKRRNSPVQQTGCLDSGQRTEIEEDRPNASLDQHAIELSSHVLSAIQRHVLAGDLFNDLADQVDAIKARVKSCGERAQLLESANEISSVLGTYQDRVRESNRETAVDFQKVLSLLNENFSFIQAGDEKSDERLRYFERGLSQATKMDSLVSLRRHLSGMLEYVRTQGKLDVAEKETKLLSITEQLHQAQAASSRLRVQMPGRLDALNHIRALAAASNGKPEGSAGLFVVDSLRALRARHGEVIASNVLEELGRKQIQPLEQNGKVFCWSNSSLVLISQPASSIASAGLLNAIPSTFEHRAFLGTRVATFKVNIRSVSTSLSRGLDEVTATLDRFCKEIAS